MFPRLAELIWESAGRPDGTARRGLAPRGGHRQMRRRDIVRG